MLAAQIESLIGSKQCPGQVRHSGIAVWITIHYLFVPEYGKTLPELGMDIKNKSTIPCENHQLCQLGKMDS